jgi:hypothetical protein
MDMWLRAAQRAEVGRVNGPDQAFYRVHGANMHLNQFAGVITDVRARLDTLSRLYLNRGPAEHRLYDLGAQAIAREALDIAAAAHDQGAVSTVPVPDFVDAAREAWPGIVHTAGWRRFERRRLRADPSSWMRWADQQRTLRHKIRWRRWRRYGV